MTFYFAPVFKYIFLYVLICLLLIAGCWTKMMGGGMRTRRGEEHPHDGGGGTVGRRCPTAGGVEGRCRCGAAGRR